MICDRLTYGRKAPWQASKRERKRGRDLTWMLRGMPAPAWVMENWPGSATILEVRCKGTRDGKPVDETRYYVSSLRTGAEALLQHVRDRWSIENSWHWPRDTQLREDAHRYRESNGVRILATLRSLAMKLYGSMATGRSRRVWPPWPMTSGGFWHCWAGDNRLRH